MPKEIVTLTTVDGVAKLRGEIIEGSINLGRFTVAVDGDEIDFVKGRGELDNWFQLNDFTTPWLLEAHN